jgi:hypothetical protein
VQRIVSIVAWSVGALMLSTVVVAQLFVGAMFAIAMWEAEGEQWLKVAFWAMAPIPVVVGIGALRLGIRGVLPGTRRTA